MSAVTNPHLDSPTLDGTGVADRLAAAARFAHEAGVDALLVTPSADLAYLTGYEATPLERLTCLVVPAHGDPVLVVPELERPAALASPVGDLGLAVHTWVETDDPYAAVAGLLARDTARVALDNHMWAEKVLALRAALPGVEQVLAGAVLRELRMRKSPAEIDALRAAGQAIDRVHARMGEWLRAGRTEREVAADIAVAIVAEGHARSDFAIVAAGPNGASPHHEPTERTIAAGDAVVVDIGGTTPAGYCSDSTRTYAVESAPDDFLAYYDVLLSAQVAACEAIRPGVTCEQVDAAARDVIEDAGYGPLFVHRTGHGIGRETHEEPYIVAGNDLPLEPGMAFSVEPGIYLEGRHGARIEDIVVCTADGSDRLNRQPRELVVLGRS
jgi:Xaa-Pro aminopeptidase